MAKDLFEKMFANAQATNMNEFNDQDVAAEGICVPEVGESVLEKLAQEGIVTAVVGDAIRDVTDAWKELKGWFLGIESKRQYINDSCMDTIRWLKDEDRDDPNLSLDMGTFKTWMKTSETFYWRYYFILDDEIFNSIMANIKKTEITEIEVIMDYDIQARTKVTRKLDSIVTIPDLIKIVEKYRSRCNLICEKMLARKRKIQNFPFQVMLLGYADLNRTVKKIVNLAT